jgi:hypothetical protein
MRETKTVTISGVEYQITQLGAKQGRAVLARLLKILGPAAEATNPVVELSKTVTEDELEFLCSTFAKVTQFSPESGKLFLLADQFDLHFAGKYGEMFQWLWACLEANYATFLGGLGLDVKNLPELAKAAMSKGQTGVSSGSSTAGGAG